MKKTNPFVRYGATNHTPTLGFLILLITTILLLSNCAGFAHRGNPTVPVMITTTPPDADIYVDGRFLGKTPATRNLDARSEKYISLEHPSFAPYRSTLPTKICPSYWLNIFWFPGLLIDAIWDNMFDVASPINIDLTKTPLPANFDPLAYYRIREFVPPPGKGLLVVYREKTLDEIVNIAAIINGAIYPLERGDIIIRPFEPGPITVSSSLLSGSLSVSIVEGKAEFVKISNKLAAERFFDYLTVAGQSLMPEERAIREAYYLLRKK